MGVEEDPRAGRAAKVVLLVVVVVVVVVEADDPGDRRKRHLDPVIITCAVVLASEMEPQNLRRIHFTDREMPSSRIMPALLSRIR